MRPLVQRCLVKDPAQRPTADALLAAVGALQPEGNWLPDSVVRMFAAPPALAPVAGSSAPTAPDEALAPTSVDASPAPTSMDAGPAPTSVDGAPAPASVDGPPVPAVVPVPDYGATQTAMASSAVTPGGSPPLALTNPASGGGGRPRRRSRSPTSSSTG